MVPFVELFLFSWKLVGGWGCCGLLLPAAVCCWLLLAAAGCFWLLLAASGCCWLLLAATGRCWLLLAAAGCCWLQLAASGCCWLLLAAAGCSWLLLMAGAATGRHTVGQKTYQATATLTKPLHCHLPPQLNTNRLIIGRAPQASLCADKEDQTPDKPIVT